MFALLALSLSLAPPAAAPSQPIAILPVTGDGVSLADLALLEDIDAVVRSAVGERKGLALQPREVTAETFRSSRGDGFQCQVNDLPCMRKIAALAGVDLMLVPVAGVSGEAVQLELTLVAVADEAIVSRSILIKGRGRAADAFVRTLVDDVMTAPRRPAPPPVIAQGPPPSTPPASAAADRPVAPADEAPSATEAAPDDGWVWPVVAGGVGAALLAVAAVTLGVVVATNGLSGGGGGGGGSGDPAAPTSGPVTVVLE